MSKDRFAYYFTKYFIDYLPNQRGSSQNTVCSYRDTFVLLFRYFDEECHIKSENLTYADFSTENIEGFLSWLENERGNGVSTRNQRLASIHSFFRYVQYKDPYGFESATDVLSVPFKRASHMPMNYMTLEEVKCLFSLPKQSDKAGLRDMAILVVLYETAARVQELIDLYPSSIQFSNPTVVTIHGKGEKTRLVPINRESSKILKRYMQVWNRVEPDEPLFVNRKGEKLTRAGIQYIINKYISIAREQNPGFFSQKITNHSFRHSKAMHLLESGVNLIYIRDFLGHSSIVTTEIYAKTNPKIKEEQLMKNSKSLESRKRYTSKEKENLLSWLKNHV